MPTSTQPQARLAGVEVGNGTRTVPFRRRPLVAVAGTAAAEPSRAHDAGTLLFGADDAHGFLRLARQAATVLKEVADEQRLTATIRGRRYLRLEGWTLLGSMLGVFPVLDTCAPVEVEGSTGWQAAVEAVTSGGSVVGSASAVCLRNEAGRNPGDEDDLISEIAQARATARAFVRPLGFVVKLAGFELTPAEGRRRRPPRGEHSAPVAAVLPLPEAANEQIGWDPEPEAVGWAWEPEAEHEPALYEADPWDGQAACEQTLEIPPAAPSRAAAPDAALADPADGHSRRRLAPAKRVLSVVFVAVAVGTALLMLALTVGPRVLPYRTYSVLGGSMSPSIPIGAEIVLRPVSAEKLAVGDVITFHRPDDPSLLVTHRIARIETKGGKKSFVTKGDANSVPDAWRVPIEGTGWREAFAVPYAGYLVQGLRSPFVRFGLLAAVGLFVVTLLLRTIWREPEPAM